MSKKYVFLGCVFIFFFTNKNSVYASEKSDSLCEICASLCRETVMYVAEDNTQNTSIVVQNIRPKQLHEIFPPVLPDMKRDPVDEKTEAEKFRATIEHIKIKFTQAPEMTVSIDEESIQTSNEYAATFTLAEFISINVETSEHSKIRKLTITDKLSEKNKNQLFLKLKAFTNIEELTLQNCWDLEEIPVAELRALPRLRCLALYKIFMDARYVGGYHDPGIKTNNLLEVLNISTLTELTLQSEEFKMEHKRALKERAREKEISISLLEAWPFKRQQQQNDLFLAPFLA